MAKVELKMQDDQLAILVKDRGTGIPNDKLSTVFQPFYRLEENTNTEGFGLGLSLADRIIKLHKGSISVSSEIEKGTVFTILLPSAGKLKTI